jgi:hypothetical protein
MNRPLDKAGALKLLKWWLHEPASGAPA